MDLLSGFITFLESLSQDPVAYSIVFFIYSVAATVFLPIPVEAGLFFSPETSFVIKALVLGSGKAVGSVIVFMLGNRVESSIDRLFRRNRFFSKFLNLMERFVARTRYVGLYIILSIPLMVDTVPVYIFSLFNQKGELEMKWFALTNFLAGITRATIVFLIFLWFGFKAF